MEEKHILMSIGVGVGVGVMLASRRTASSRTPPSESSPSSPGATPEDVERELMQLVVDGRESEVTFDEFPYYLSQQIQIILTSAAYIHLKKPELSKHTQNLLPASRTILLSGPSELYQQRLTKALAHYFQANLLLLDVTDFSIKIHSKYGTPSKDTILKRSTSETLLKKISFLFKSSPQRIESEGRSMQTVPLKRTDSWSFDEEVLMRSLEKVLVSISKSNPIILYIRDVQSFLQRSDMAYSLFVEMLTKLSGPVLILGSRLLGSDNYPRDVDGKFSTIFSYNIGIKPPEGDIHLLTWNFQLGEDMNMMKMQDKRNHIARVLAANDIECDDLGSICLTNTMLLCDNIEEIVVSTVSSHLMNKKNPEYRNGKLIISPESLLRVLFMFEETKPCVKITPELATTTESEKPAPENTFEKDIISEVIPASKIAVTFDDIGSLVEIKESLHELVLLPLRRPDLFKGGLLKPCKGVLLFGPPGTGKTMLAKAIAKEAGASFINVSMSTIATKWFGESDKYVRALFTVAENFSPAIIFIDEVDSLLGRRSMVGENEAMRRIKNEFMARWDGLLTKPGERILVLAATNRPFDLDEAAIRRFERRIMVGLPSLESREAILRKLLSKEKVEALDFKELATLTEGYSGSDLKNLCVTAAYRPVRELIQKERLMLANKYYEQGETSEIILRALSMEDLRHAKNQVSSSYAADNFAMRELKQWNEQYGEGGSRKRQQEQLSYFL